MVVVGIYNHKMCTLEKFPYDDAFNKYNVATHVRGQSGLGLFCERQCSICAWPCAHVNFVSSMMIV